MHKISLLILSAATAMSAVAGIDAPARRSAMAAPRQAFAGVTPAKAPFFANGSFAVDFTIEGADALAPVYTDNFDTGMSAWTIEPAGSAIEWCTKRIAAAGNAKSFSAIDPDDVASLYVEGPYQVYKRAISSATSADIEIPDRATLSFYAGYSLNYNDMASLVLSISTDGFVTEQVLWDSTKQPGERPWAWRYITADLSDYAGQTVKLRFTYGPGTADSFGTGGYMADFAIDGLAVSAPKSVESVDVMTGDIIRLVPITDAASASFMWSFPGATPSTSTDANPAFYYTEDGTYDITLTVTDAEGNTSSKTRQAFAKVTGTSPVARILPPATFRSASNYKHLVAPLVPVQFSDASTGFPTRHEWMFTFADEDPDVITYSDEADPEVAFNYLHDHFVGLTASNSHGSSDATCEVTAEYSDVITNLRPGDYATTFDMQDWGIFPGSNTRKITAYAERFSAPSRPVMIDGAYVYFNRADAEEITDQIANVGVHIYTSKDGKPDKRVDSWWWSVYELDLPSTSTELVGTAFPFTDCPIIDDEFFIVVDGLPEFSETCAVSFAMAGFRAEGNTAYMLKDGEWIAAADYFPAGANHTSFLIYPSVNHSVMKSLAEDEVVNVGKEAGTVDYTIFSYLGYKTPVETDCDWLHVEGEPNGMTVDDIHIRYDALPAGMTSREGKLTLTDGASTLDIVVKQSNKSGVADMTAEAAAPGVFPAVFTDSFRVYGLGEGADVTVYSISGSAVHHAIATDGSVSVDASAFTPGVYLIHTPGHTLKAIKK